MPLQNRVTPFGEIVVPPPGSPARGDVFGNRGNLHDTNGRIRRTWRSRTWITCVLQFKGRHRTLLQPGRYTELFFLDEATAFAAGHRPCGECRWHDYQRFRALLPEFAGQSVTALDAVLQRERLDAAGRQIVEPGSLDQQPDGCLVALPDVPGRAFLKWGTALYPWSLDGYGAPIAAPIPPSGTVLALTPPTLRRAIARGFRPRIHRTGPQAHQAV